MDFDFDHFGAEPGSTPGSAFVSTSAATTAGPAVYVPPPPPPPTVEKEPELADNESIPLAITSEAPAALAPSTNLASGEIHELD